LMYSLSKHCKHEFMSQSLVSSLLLYSMMSSFIHYGHLESHRRFSVSTSLLFSTDVVTSVYRLQKLKMAIAGIQNGDDQKNLPRFSFNTAGHTATGDRGGEAALEVATSIAPAGRDPCERLVLLL